MMSDLSTSTDGGRIELTLDEAAFARGAVYAAAFGFIDRCWVHLDRPAPGRLSIALRPKVAGLDLAAAAAELEDELRGHAWRQRLVDDGRDLVEAVVAKAFGAPAGGAAPDLGTLDDLLGDGGAFEDPLGIAMSWEDKYGKKDEGADAK